MKENQIKQIIRNMTKEEMVGQLFCLEYKKNRTYEENERLIKKIKPGGFFVAGVSEGEIKELTETANSYTNIPVIIAADVENGPGHAVPGETKLPYPMAWGACDDCNLIKNAHRLTAEICRKMGIHWTFSPIVDINMNFNNPVVNVRAISDSPKQVAKIARAAVEGLQEKGCMAATCKHFPGDGVDDRNQHFCTTVNSLSKEKWSKTFGYVYREMIDADAASVMVGHIALPAFDTKLNEWYGYPPATLSRNIITGLLRNTLGFKGCIVSDALSMIGASAAAAQREIATKFINAGGDMLLFPLEEYYDNILEDVQNGIISEERLQDAVFHVLQLKNRVRLLDDNISARDISDAAGDIAEIGEEIAEKSLNIVRDIDGILPLKLKKGSKILLLNICKDKTEDKVWFRCGLDTLESELNKRGFKTKKIVNAKITEFREEAEDADAVLINCKISSNDYLGGTLRITSSHIGPFWRGAVLQWKNVIFTSFGDPYKIYDFPYIKTYINAFSANESSQRAFVKALFGEIPFCGKSPVRLEGFYESDF